MSQTKTGTILTESTTTHPSGTKWTRVIDGGLGAFVFKWPYAPLAGVWGGDPDQDSTGLINLNGGDTISSALAGTRTFSFKYFAENCPQAPYTSGILYYRVLTGNPNDYQIELWADSVAIIDDTVLRTVTIDIPDALVVDYSLLYLEVRVVLPVLTEAACQTVNWGTVHTIAFETPNAVPSDAGVCAASETLPNGPSNLIARMASWRKISLEWLDNSDDEEGQILTKGGVQIADLAADVIEYEDTLDEDDLGIPPSWLSVAPCYEINAYNVCGSTVMYNPSVESCLNGVFVGDPATAPPDDGDDTIVYNSISPFLSPGEAPYNEIQEDDQDFTAESDGADPNYTEVTS